MKIGMQTWGSHGDIRPFLALAEGLQAAGHEVTLLMTCFDSAIYSTVTSINGVNIKLIASPVISVEEAEKISRLVYGIRDPMKQVATILQRGFEPVEDQMFAAAQQLSKDNDLLIAHYFMHPLQIAAEKEQKPYISVVLANIVVPSVYSNPLGFNGLGQWGHRLIWWITRFSINRVLLHYPNRLRKQLCMPPTRDILTQVWMSPHLTLLAVSPQFCQRQPDWPASVQVCGFLDTPDLSNLTIEGVIPPSLKAFLDAGEPPVYMTFGSWMPHDIASQTTTLRLLTDAAKRAGCRAIIQSPSWQDCGFASDDQVFYLSAAPHYAIFPHCHAIVHHGGAGTTQSTTRSGKPSIVVAHLSEQEHWGRELRRMGVAGKFLRRRSLSSSQLARQIKYVLNTPGLSVKANTIADAMRMENGVNEAVKLIQQKFVV
ncbi:glycosyltransferase [Undibacterium sp. SXout7W]|uniref:glycosyltransferase n=1 Tax=Undibacterium sp. SXout7W TaxID=3413049 RepID=UPI003BF3D507